jgi:hypothetical protein
MESEWPGRRLEADEGLYAENGRSSMVQSPRSRSNSGGKS